MGSSWTILLQGLWVVWLKPCALDPREVDHQVHLVVAAEVDHGRLGERLQFLLETVVLAAELPEHLPRLGRPERFLSSCVDLEDARGSHHGPQGCRREDQPGL